MEGMMVGFVMVVIGNWSKWLSLCLNLHFTISTVFKSCKGPML